jgi:hypothetical protein
VVGHLLSALRTLRHRRDFEAGMADEMRFHIEEYTADLVRSGVPAAEAARRARREFGSVDNAKEDCRDAFGLRLFDELHQDLRQAVRRIRRTPGFTLAALATLALAIGANLTIFAVVDAVLLRPLPFPDAGRLVSVYNTYPKAGVLNDGCSLPNYYERRGSLPAFAGWVAYRDGTVIAGPTGATEQVPATWVTPDYFTTLGLVPRRGRAPPRSRGSGAEPASRPMRSTLTAWRATTSRPWDSPCARGASSPPPTPAAPSASASSTRTSRAGIGHKAGHRAGRAAGRSASACSRAARRGRRRRRKPWSAWSLR